jgi:hypothetical protein
MKIEIYSKSPFHLKIENKLAKIGLKKMPKYIIIKEQKNEKFY